MVSEVDGKGVFYWEPQAPPSYNGGYMKGAWNSDGTPTIALEGFIVGGGVIDTNGYYKIVNRNSGKVLDVEANSSADGAEIVQWTDNGG
jgi:hypothetical protein